MPDRFSLSVDALDIIGERLTLDLRVFPFEIPHLATTLDERSRVAETTLHDAERHGLAHRGRFEPDVEDALVLLARWPGLAMAQALRDGGQLVARASSNGKSAVLAVQRNGTVDFELARPSVVFGSLLELVPLRKPFPGRSVTFPRDEPTEPERGTGRILQPVRPALSGYASQREIARRMMERPCRAGGMVLAFARGRHRRGEPLVWRDTDVGRFTARTTVGRDGKAWCTYTPADGDRLARQVAELWISLT